jgi:L-alanine-DL-glutamate epimerase-like enolase superfamily enzyme
MEEGYASIKVKVGGQPLEDDMRVVFEVAEAAAGVSNSQRTGARVRVDANRAWQPETATQVLTALRAWGIEFVEEPVAGGQWSKLAGCSVPLAADESLAQGYAVAKLASLGVRTVVLKPTVLGLSRSVALAKAARSLGMTVVVSHTFDGKVAYAAAAALALAVGSSDVASGLGPHPGLAAWPGEMPLALDASRLVPTAAPGLGIPRPERLQVQIR